MLSVWLTKRALSIARADEGWARWKKEAASRTQTRGCSHAPTGARRLAFKARVRCTYLTTGSLLLMEAQ